MRAVGDLLGDVLSRDQQRKLRSQQALRQWSRIVGKDIAGATEPQSLRGGTLFVATRSAAWTNELTLLKAQIMEKLHEALGERVVRDIVFRTGRLDRQPRRKSPGSTSSSQRAHTEAKLTPPERELVASLLRNLDDPRLQAAVRGCAEVSLRMRSIRRRNRWRECGACKRQNLPGTDHCEGCGRPLVLEDSGRGPAS